MRRLPFYIRIIVLVVLVIVKNFIILALTPPGITKSSIKKHKKEEVMAYVRLAFACSVLLGTAWVFGILAITSPRNVFQWLFCIFNSLQGLLHFTKPRSKEAMAESFQTSQYRKIFYEDRCKQIIISEKL